MASLSNVQNRPQGYLDSNGRPIPDSFSDEAFQGDYVGGMNLIYKGFARPGASTSAAVWQIAKLAYDVNNNITSITWPQNTSGVASNDYAFQWTQRASYTYS